MTNTTFGQWATLYAERLGWSVFPLAPHGKQPITPNGFKDATTDAAQIRAWWDAEPLANIGVACGASNLAVIDLDGDAGRARWQMIVDSLGLVATKYAQQNTGGGGVHLVYAQGAERIRNTAKKLGEGIDTRGDGGYIVVAPSIHPTGTPYLWEQGKTPNLGMDVMPTAILELLRGGVKTPTAPPTPPSNLSRILQRTYERVANAAQGCRNDTLNRAGFYLFHLVREGQLNEGEAREVLESAAMRAGLEQRETLATINSAYRGAMGA